MRRGAAIVLKVAAGRMHAEGHVFYRSANGVWLTEHVPPDYIELTGD
jgi:putative RNA 2'-phosphotransferase